MAKISSIVMRNTKIFILAIVVSLTLVFFVKDPSLFEASVLNIGEISFIQEKQRDIAYKTTGNILDIFVSTGLLINSNLDKLFISIGYDPTISIPGTNVEYQTDYKIISSGDSLTNITIGLSSGIDYKKSLLVIPFSGNSNHILIQDAYVILSDGIKKDLSVGNLTTQYLHN